MASDLLWSDVWRAFDPGLMGSLPDLRVPGTSAGDWQALLDLVTSSGWRFEYRARDTVRPLPPAREVLSRRPEAESPVLRVRPYPHLLLIFRFYAAEEIDFDVDLREIQGQRRLDEFCGLLRTIGRHLGKPVLMDAEGGDAVAHPVLGFSIEADRVITIDMPPAS